MDDEIFRRAMILRIDALEARQERLQEGLEDLRDTHKDTNKSLEDLLGILNSWKGAMKVLEFLGKVAKPVGYIAAAIAGISAFFHFGGKQ